MTFTVDANVLVYSTNPQANYHQEARRTLASAVAGPELLYLFWPVLVAYIRVVTQPALLETPVPLARALDNVQHLLGSPFVRTGGESNDFAMLLRAVADPVPARGRLIHDAHIVALMRQYGVATIWTHDRDFRLFDGIRVHDPFA